MFGTDIKGNVAWTLRAATPDDLDAVYPMVEDVLTRDLVESFLSMSSCCTICETSLKGTKEGEGFKSVIMGVVLVDLSLGARDVQKGFDAGTAKYGNLVTIFVDSEFPDQSMAKKMLLGSMKLMKEDSVIEVVHCNQDPKRVALVKDCLFKEDGTSALDFPKFVCNLKFENPDPLKKIMWTRLGRVVFEDGQPH